MALPATAQIRIDDPGAGTSAESLPQSGNPVFESLLPEIQDEILAESEMVQQNCERDANYAFFHDCECIAIRFIQERLERGPEAHWLNIRNGIRSQCVNVPGIAGHSFDYCMNTLGPLSSGTRNLPDDQLEEHCRCFARTMARNYDSAPNPNYRYISHMRVNSMRQCRDQRQRLQQLQR